MVLWRSREPNSAGTTAREATPGEGRRTRRFDMPNMMKGEQAMTAVSVEPVGYRNGKEMVQAVILSNTTPGTLPTNGANVAGMNASQIFAPFSLLFITGEAESKVYITNESGVFVPQ